jgi:AcrR family transcriptional regulator
VQPIGFPAPAVSSLTRRAPRGILPAVHALVDPTGEPGVDDAPRRGRILWALAVCMTEKGYQATTISDIARVGRVSKTVVYAHFRDKEECLLELYSRANATVLATVRQAQEDARAARLPWEARLRAGIAAYLETLAAGPPVAWAALVEVQAAGRRAQALRRQVIDDYVDLIADVAAELATELPDEVRPVSRELVLAAVGGINELMLARVERAQAERLAEDTDAATAVVVGLLERRG